MQLDVVVGFFILGALAQLVRSDLRLPTGLYQSCVIFLLLAIGLKGGAALSTYSASTLIPQSLAVLAFGTLLPLLAFPLLYWIGKWSRLDAAATAAHYGSVSVATYAVAVALLETKGIDYEAYFPLFVALLEVPAIVVGILLARKSMQNSNKGRLAHELTCNQGFFSCLAGSPSALGPVSVLQQSCLFWSVISRCAGSFSAGNGESRGGATRRCARAGCVLAEFWYIYAPARRCGRGCPGSITGVVGGRNFPVGGTR